MTDPFDVATPTQSRVIVAALATYVVLFAIEFATGNVYAAAAADLVLAVFVLPASALVLRRATTGTTDRVAVAAALAFAVAGLTIGYEGLATLELVPRIAAVEVAGTASLLVALALYLYRSR